MDDKPLTCPCEDGLPDPCTLCGEPADGICRLDTLIGWKHRAEKAEAERDTLAARLTDAFTGIVKSLGVSESEERWAIREFRIAAAADPDNRSEP